MPLPCLGFCKKERNGICASSDGKGVNQRRKKNKCKIVCSFAV